MLGVWDQTIKPARATRHAAQQLGDRSISHYNAYLFSLHVMMQVSINQNLPMLSLM